MHAVDHVSFISSQEAFLPRSEFDLFIHNLRTSSFRTATYPLIPTGKYLKYIKYKLKRRSSKKLSKNKTKYTFPLRLPLPTKTNSLIKSTLNGGPKFQTRSILSIIMTGKSISFLIDVRRYRQLLLGSTLGSPGAPHQS